MHNQKLSMGYFGPFLILARIGPVAYKQKLPLSTQIHLVFHVSVLKKCTGEPQPACVPEPLLLNAKGHPFQLLKLLGNHMIKKNGKWHEEVLIQWQGLTYEEATWESYPYIQTQYPTFNLEDKVLFNGGGNGTKRRTKAVIEGGQVEKIQERRKKKGNCG